MRHVLTLALCLNCCLAGSAAYSAPAPIHTPPASNLAVPTPTPAAPASMSSVPPSNFDPSQFAPITTSSLPKENGQPVVMRVNSRAVSWEDFTAQVRMAGASILAEHPGNELNIMAALAGPVTDALILQELYRDFAAINTLTVQPAEVDQQQAELKISRNSKINKATDLLTQAQLRQLITDSLIREKVDKFLGDRATSMPPTMQEITSFTAAVKPTVSPGEITRARHIVVRATPDMSEFSINDAKTRAEEALAKIRSGADFATTARQYSQDRFTAYQGGNIGYYTTGTMYKEFEAAAAKLAPGEVSEVIRTPVGYHIIQVTERQPDDLRLQLDKYKRQMAVQEWKAQAIQAAKVERYLEQ